MRGGRPALQQARLGQHESARADRHGQVRLLAGLHDPLTRARRGAVRGHHDHARLGGVVDGVVRDHLHAARDPHGRGRLGDGEELERHHLVHVGAASVHMAVLEDLPGSREVDHGGVVGDAEGDRDLALLGRAPASPAARRRPRPPAPPRRPRRSATLRPRPVSPRPSTGPVVAWSLRSSAPAWDRSPSRGARAGTRRRGRPRPARAPSPRSTTGPWARRRTAGRTPGARGRARPPGRPGGRSPPRSCPGPSACAGRCRAQRPGPCGCRSRACAG